LRSYPGKWGAVSGYLEGDPVEQVYREIKEELGLRNSDIKLLRSSSPVSVVDAQKDIEWKVHPFLGEIINKERLVLNWENDEFRWVDVKNVKNFNTVPGLMKVLDHLLGLET